MSSISYQLKNYVMVEINIFFTSANYGVCDPYVAHQFISSIHDVGQLQVRKSLFSCEDLQITYAIISPSSLFSAISAKASRTLVITTMSKFGALLAYPLVYNITRIIKLRVKCKDNT